MCALHSHGKFVTHKSDTKCTHRHTNTRIPTYPSNKRKKNVLCFQPSLSYSHTIMPWSNRRASLCTCSAETTALVLLSRVQLRARARGLDIFIHIRARDLSPWNRRAPSSRAFTRSRENIFFSFRSTDALTCVREFVYVCECVWMQAHARVSIYVKMQARSYMMLVKGGYWPHIYPIEYACPFSSERARTAVTCTAHTAPHTVALYVCMYVVGTRKVCVLSERLFFMIGKKLFIMCARVRNRKAATCTQTIASPHCTAANLQHVTVGTLVHATVDQMFRFNR